jgi:hypothetical protein
VQMGNYGDFGGGGGGGGGSTTGSVTEVTLRYLCLGL